MHTYEITASEAAQNIKNTLINRIKKEKDQDKRSDIESLLRHL